MNFNDFQSKILTKIKYQNINVQKYLSKPTNFHTFALEILVIGDRKSPNFLAYD